MTTHDENWSFAESLQLTPATEQLDPDQRGVLAARQHPTGWFISARYAPDLDENELTDFAEFARVRTYLLLDHGLQERVWQAVEDGSWRTYCAASRLDLPEPVDALR